MAQSHLKVGIPLDKDELRDEIGGGVYVDPKASNRDLEACKKIWAAFVTDSTHRTHRGVIQGFQSHTGVKTGPDGGEPMNSGDMRDTWVLCVVDQKGMIVAWETFLPWVDADWSYDYDTQLAEEVASGELTLSKAKRLSQESAETRAQTELSEELDAGVYDRIVKV